MEKEKLSSQQFMLIVNGPSCGGKSTVANTILEQYGGIFNAKSDHVKWLISDYQAELHRGIIHNMMLEIIKIALKSNLSVLKEGSSFELDKLVQIANDFNVPLFIVNVAAPKDILDKRFLERIEAKKNGAKISNIDHKRFEEINNIYLATKMDTPLEFDSSLQSPEEIASNIVKYIKNLNEKIL